MAWTLISAILQDYSEPSPLALGGAMLVPLILGLGFCALLFWKVFTKAGHPGWASLVPIYNVIVLLKIAGRPVWWFILMCIPIVNIVIIIMVSLDVAKAFGKSAGFGIGLALVSMIFYPILGFGSATYRGPGTSQA